MSNAQTKTCKEGGPFTTTLSSTDARELAAQIERMMRSHGYCLTPAVQLMSREALNKSCNPFCGLLLHAALHTDEQPNLRAQLIERMERNHETSAKET